VIYFSGIATEDIAAAAQEHPIGIMIQPDNHIHRFRESFPTGWAIDNGCFTKGDAFDLNHFLRYVARLSRKPAGCHFVVAPDVVGNAAATLARSLPVMPTIRRMGLPVAFVAQDGLEDMEIPWGEFDALFIGGTTDWKLSPQATWITRMAKAAGKHVHMGRVNSQKRFITAMDMGCDSADGTFLKFGPDANIPRLVKWLDVAAKCERRVA
jgi:hypothetical protein